MAVQVPLARKVFPSSPATISAHVEIGNSTFSVICCTFISWVLEPHWMINVAVFVAEAFSALKVTLVVPTPPDAGETVSHLGTFVTVHESVAVRLTDTEPPAAGIDT